VPPSVRWAGARRAIGTRPTGSAVSAGNGTCLRTRITTICLLAGKKPSLDAGTTDFDPTLCDPPSNPDLRALTRLCCKMATGSGKTVVMAMLIAWAFCNRGVNAGSRESPNAVLVC